MGARPEFWRRLDDEQAAARFGAEHGIVASLSGEVLELAAGSEALLPPWPPVVNLPGLAVPIPAGAPEPDRSVCQECGTALAKREGEWRHEVGFRDRDGCVKALPK